MGTPRYLAPELVSGADASPRSDIYATGLVAYELLTGDYWTDASTPVGLMAAIADEEPLRLPDEVKIPQGLREIVHQMLEKQPEQRYGSADEVLRDVQSLRREGDTGPRGSVKKDTITVRLGNQLRELQRGRVGKVVVAAVVMMVVGGGGFLVFSGEERAPEGTESSEELMGALEEAAENQGSSEELTDGPTDEPTDEPTAKEKEGNGEAGSAQKDEEPRGEVGDGDGEKEGEELSGERESQETAEKRIGADAEPKVLNGGEVETESEGKESGEGVGGRGDSEPQEEVATEGLEAEEAGEETEEVEDEEPSEEEDVGGSPVWSVD